MKHIPTLPKIALNILLYIFYVLVISLTFSFVFPQILNILGKPIPEVNDPVFYKTQIVILVLVLIISTITRKYLYIGCCSYSEDEVKEVPVKKQKEKKKETVESESFDDEMKIYIDKEIK
jgi:hypothetical protein